MNNKLLARIATVAISASMLSTVAFAGETGSMPKLSDGADASTKVLSFMDGDVNIIKPATEADQVTMMAYVVGDSATFAACDYVDEATTPMIALDQVAYADSFAAGVNVAASKLEGAKKIVVKRGDSNGGTDKWLFALAADTQKLTVMNGAVATDLDIVGGKATLPKTAEFGKTMTQGYSMTLYSWVAVDNETGAEGTEYIIPAEGDVQATVADLEGKTLYAKFVCNAPYGDVTGDGKINALDSADVVKGAKGLTVSRKTKLPLFEGSTILIGDVTGDGKINALDSADVVKGAKGLTVSRKTGTAIYYVNK